MMLDLLLAAFLVFAPSFFVTGYTTADDETAPWADGITASGVEADPANRIVACPRQLELGTKVYIQGLGGFTCLDRGGAIRGARLDVLVASVKEAYRVTGHRRVLVVAP